MPDRHVVGDRPGSSCIQEPQPLLGEGQRQWSSRETGARITGEGRCCGKAFRGPAPGRPRWAQSRGRPGAARPRSVWRTRRKMRGQQGVAAQLEEAVVNADAIDAEDLRPDVGQQLLERAPRGGVENHLAKPLPRRGGQGRRSSLPLGVRGMRRARRRRREPGAPASTPQARAQIERRQGGAGLLSGTATAGDSPGRLRGRSPRPR